MRKTFHIFLLSLIIGVTAQAQTVKNVQARADGNSVIISYDLIGSADGQVFKVDIKSSHDNFVSPLKEITGDFGENQSAGIAKTVIWNAKDEIGKFLGTISFEVIAEITFTPLQFLSPTAATGFKIGKPAKVSWEGGNQGVDMRMSLLRNNQQLLDIGSVGNQGNYSWNVPKSVDKGENYQLKLFDPSKPNDAAMSAEFKLKKTSILVYIIPAAVVVGVGVALLLGGDDDCSDECNPSCSNYNPSSPACSSADPLAAPPAPPGG